MESASPKKSGFLLLGLACILICISACSAGKPDGTGSLPATEPSTAVTSVSEPTLTPTKKPTKTPTPTPVSVYITREELPDGRLFEESYYAVLPGEGAYMNVFDCYGEVIGSFPFTDGESTPPIGLYTETTLAVYWRLNQSEVNLIEPMDDYDSLMSSTPNGFYQIIFGEKKNMVILYNPDGEHVRTLTAPIAGESEMCDIVVRCLGEETVVSFSIINWETNSKMKDSTAIYFVASDGTINEKCEVKNMANKPVGLIGKEYLLVYGDQTNESPFELIDFSGNVVMKGIDYPPESTFRLWSNEAVTSIYISDYFTVDGVAYDASLQPVEKDQVGPLGELIYGVEYDVEGIPCTNTYLIKAPIFYADRFYFTDGYEDLVAVGTQNDQIAVKTKDAEYVFDYDGKATFPSINNHYFVLSGQQVISLETGEFLSIPSGLTKIVTADEYLIAGSNIDLYSDLTTGGYIIDNDGNVRYALGDSSCKSTLGEYIILYRGPYVGIADLNGDWIIKTLTWELTRDEDYLYPWE